jgi:hypothetical protein
VDKKWKEVDQEAERLILKVANRESEGWLRVEDAKNFSCQDLGTLYKLWEIHNMRVSTSPWRNISIGAPPGEGKWEMRVAFVSRVETACKL